MPSSIVVRSAAACLFAGTVASASTLTGYACPSPGARERSSPHARVAETAPLAEETPAEASQPRPPSSRVEVVASDRVYRGYSFDGHVHTSYSRDARHGVTEVLALASRAGLDAVMITDHGSSRAREDVANYEGPVSVTVGAEFGGTFGHALTWNFVDANAVHAADPDDLPTLGRIVHERGAIVVLAHPGWWIRGLEVDPRYFLEYDVVRRGGEGEAIDAYELWNGTYPMPTSKLVDAWLALLERNVYVPAVGGSDFHQLRGNAIGEPRNVVLCEVDVHGELVQPLDRCILEASRVGRLYVTDGPSLALTVNGRVSGDVLRVDASSTLRIHARAIAAEGGTLTIYLGREPIDLATLEPGVPLERDLAVPAPVDDSFVYADVARPSRAPSETARSLIANPIRVDVGIAVADWRGPALEGTPRRAPIAFRRGAGRRSQQASNARSGGSANRP